MSNDTWKIGFTRALIDAIVREGGVVRKDGGSFYGGWQDYEVTPDVRAEIERVGIDYAKTTWTESEWHEFMGTFYEGDTRCVGIDAEVSLKSSRKGGRGYTFRWQGSVSDLIIAVVR
jgi:hypothetical protein